MATVKLIAEQNKEISLPLDALQSLDAIFNDAEIAMRKLDLDNVERIQLANADDLPAIEVVHVNYNGQDIYVVIDGYHRKDAAIKRGDTHIKAIARTYADEDAIVNAAFEANSRHGLASSKQSRSAWAVWLHVKHPEMEQNDIARAVGLVQSSVSRAIAAHERALQKAAAEAVTAEGEEVEEVEDVDYNKAIKQFLKAMIAFNEATVTIETDADIIKLLDEVARKGKANEKEVAGRVGGLLVSASKHIATKPAKKTSAKKVAEEAKPAETTPRTPVKGKQNTTRVPAGESA